VWFIVLLSVESYTFVISIASSRTGVLFKDSDSEKSKFKLPIVFVISQPAVLEIPYTDPLFFYTVVRRAFLF